MTSHTPLALVGIHTDIGKTITGAVLTQALGCDYWKPVQAGGLSHTDSDVLRECVSNPRSRIYPEAFRLTTAASPHVAARLDNINIHIADVQPPSSDCLLIETAGGVMSPMTSTETVADVVAHNSWACMLVVQHYLGSISHTLSAVTALRSRGITPLGLIINGERQPDSEQFICDYTELPILAHIPHFEQLTPHFIAQAAQQLRLQLPAAFSPWMRP
ncbi:dethiobiotin synthase [Hydromonas duriensis]|uniref:ATP-dependent dethiobiotin synthetase BioD n=1 Tax=Hydromonas duriensis TaxID=1527608 RepID=A0A4R6Y991_9BURK|nr:dethiobiotin synthase [Hydromonas duriensis]TDR32010.1 dethiobiotin synthetase [Hydromonas duriensis]